MRLRIAMNIIDNPQQVPVITYFFALKIFFKQTSGSAFL